MNHSVNIQNASLFGFDVFLHREPNVERCVAKASARTDGGYLEKGSFGSLVFDKEVLVYVYDMSTMKTSGYNTINGVGRIIVYLDLKGDTWLVCQKNTACEYTCIFSRFNPLIIACELTCDKTN